MPRNRECGPKDRLVHGTNYKGRCRNATIARWDAEREVFWHWQQMLGRIFLQTIRSPSDETIPELDVFDVVEELPDPKFEIPFDPDRFLPKAAFTGNPEDLLEESEAEMWRRPQHEKLR
jgi:hypothetical protein